ncbi:MAG TPA: PE-PPE domain-containing protein [Mycobacterium sp.]|uniref:PE-PPE domain-containing protein n=1 Tax=Mycobacterium sp. TaxID=1785 RepID=UPI002BED8CB3|nr:PE-PPE domain-containing protein [Mycobacterium sp.]HME77301.1 PE-PPE domain-containing protein [Mycobacterium sp.]
MSEPRLRSRGYASLVIACAAATGALSIGLWAFPSEVKALIAEARLLADEGWIMSGTGVPTPDNGFLSSVESLYLSQDSAYTFDPLTTPEQFCPFVCNPSEPNLGFGDSLNTGASDLNNVIVPALQGGNDVAVLGYSQSADVATVEMNDLLNNTPAGVNLNDLSVTLLGDPQSPIGGILDRFQFPDGVGAFSLTPEPQHVPFVDIPLSLATTPTTGIATDIYTGEYDGWADFPEDPSNLFADLNALIGIETVHPYYPDPTPGVNLDTNGIISLGSIGNTNFYEIPAPLPTLAFMYDGGPAGQFFYDSFAPFATLFDDWGYGNPGDPGAGIEVNGVDPIGAAGPWTVDATGQLVESGGAGFAPEMDPLQMLAGMEYATVQTFVGPIDDLLEDAGQSPLPTSFVDSLLSGYDATNQLDASLLTEWTALTASIPSLAPDAIFSGDPAISAQPLIDLVGYGFDIFNFFGA